MVSYIFKKDKTANPVVTTGDEKVEKVGNGKIHLADRVEKKATASLLRLLRE